MTPRLRPAGIPREIADIFNFGGRITSEPLADTRGEDGRWIGGSERQWIDELTVAVLEYHAGGFIYRGTDDTPADRGAGPLGQGGCPGRPRGDRQGGAAAETRIAARIWG